MDNSFFAYLERLEFLAFFSAYPLVYALVHVFSTSIKWKPAKRLSSLLPYAYALTGTLFLGMQIKNLYPDFSFENISLSAQQPFLFSWALLTIVFWIPALGKRTVLSLLHSFVFFFFLAKDLFQHIFTSSVDKTIVKNDMKLFTDSLLLNFGTLSVIFIIYLIVFFKPAKESTEN
jgi:hypothetical protein